MMISQRKPQQNPNINARQYDDALFLVDTRLGVLHELNTVGARIWELCDGNHTEQAISQAIVDEFDTTEQQANDDLEGFLREMQERTLIIFASG